MDNVHGNEEKLKKFDDLIARGVVNIHVDARKVGVRLPSQYLEEFRLRLNMGQPNGALDNVANIWGVRETLVFNGVRFSVALPWNSIYLMAAHGDEEPTIFSEDIPEELVQLAMSVPNDDAKPEDPAPGSRGGHLKLVK